MNFFLANPVVGAWALLGIPAVLAIHFLHTPSRPRAVSTLFLLEQLEPESVSGRRIERLRHSIPLWLQLLAVLTLAGMLAQPRWLRKDSTQTILVLLDSSVSMRAFQKPLLQSLPNRLRTLGASAAHTEWLLLETDPAAGRLYAGGRLEDLNAALKQWKPRLGLHDFQPSLRASLSMVNGHGLVLFVTDRAVPVPAGVEELAVGHPINNVGFSGVRTDNGSWEALVTNFGTTVQTRTWHLESKEGKPLGNEQTLEIQPGGTQSIRGGFPTGSEGIRVTLSPDEFTLDDSLPLIRPEPKRLRVQFGGGDRIGSWVDAFVRSETALDRVNESPDLTLRAVDFNSPIPATPDKPGILFFKEPSPTPGLVKEMVVAERDPLTAGLSWEGLVVSGTTALDRQPGDEPLLWMGQRPLIVRRGQQLLVGFDVAQSNAPRLPSFVLLLHRFLDSVRVGVTAPEAANFETNQELEPAQRGKEGLLRAPAEPGFFETGDPNARLKGAAHFADPRESDFREASSSDKLEEVAKARRERHSEQDAFTAFWVLFLGTTMTCNWLVSEKKRRTP